MYISTDKLFFEKRVESSTNPNESHLVVYGRNVFEEGSGLEGKFREWSCTCPDFQFRGKSSGRYCKHINHVLTLSVEQGGFCDWEENSNMPPVYLKDSNGDYKPFAPFKRNGEWVKAVYVPDEALYDEFDVLDKKVIVVYFDSNLPAEIRKFMNSNPDVLEGFLNDTGKEMTYISDENLPPITVQKPVMDFNDDDFPKQKPTIIRK